mgnify:CR=1 FL=1
MDCEVMFSSFGQQRKGLQASGRLEQEWTQEDEVAILGFDVKALFASLSARQTARVVRDAYIGSELEYKGIDYKSAAMYVRYGMSDAEIRSLKLTRLVPVRRKTRGQRNRSSDARRSRHPGSRAPVYANSGARPGDHHNSCRTGQEARRQCRSPPQPSLSAGLSWGDVV